MTETTTPPNAAPVVWTRTPLPKHLHDAAVREQAQATLGSGKRQNLQDTLVAIIARGLNLPVSEG